MALLDEYRDARRDEDIARLRRVVTLRVDKRAGTQISTSHHMAPEIQTR
ncbi:hypothetical protein [Arthrobacter castelli]|nr:hypothetical protein [Arthrobacter castelli]